MVRNPTQIDCCVEPVSCLIGSDDFDRSDSSNLGPKWVEVSGDWEISNNTLVAVEDGIVLSSFRQSRPCNSTYNYSVEVEIIDTASSWGIICKYVDADNFDWIDLTLDGVQLWPTFYRRVSGVDTVVMDRNTNPSGDSFSNGNQTMLICYSETEWSITYLGGDLAATWTTCDVSVATLLPTNSSVGFVGFIKGDFDNFAYYYHNLSNPGCSVCSCYCQSPVEYEDYSCMPEVLTLTLVPTAIFSDCTSSPDEIELTLYQVANPPGSTIPTSFSSAKLTWWSLDFYLPVWDQFIRFSLECNSLNGTFVLNLFPNFGFAIHWDSLDTEWGKLPSSVKCEPIVMLFKTLIALPKQQYFEGPYICDPLSAAEYWAYITE